MTTVSIPFKQINKTYKGLRKILQNNFKETVIAIQQTEESTKLQSIEIGICCIVAILANTILTALPIMLLCLRFFK